ncbi:MAG: glycosyltransferase family 2 protein [Planctomycetota bacterium]
MEANPRPALSIVIPLFQEASGVPALAEALFALKKIAHGQRELHFVLVDDGSDDGTGPLLKEHCAEIPDTRILSHAQNRGLCEALFTGSEAATTPYIAWLDSDLSYEPGLCLQLADELDRGADLALASCYHPQGEVEGVSGFRLALSAIASRLYRALCGGGLHTYTCMLRAYRRELLSACKPQRGGFLGVTEVLLRALRAKKRCVEIPAVLRRRRQGQSKMRIFAVGLGHLGLMGAWLLRRF